MPRERSLKSLSISIGRLLAHFLHLQSQQLEHKMQQPPNPLLYVHLTSGPHLPAPLLAKAHFSKLIHLGLFCTPTNYKNERVYFSQHFIIEARGSHPPPCEHASNTWVPFPSPHYLQRNESSIMSLSPRTHLVFNSTLALRRKEKKKKFCGVNFAIHSQGQREWLHIIIYVDPTWSPPCQLQGLPLHLIDFQRVNSTLIVPCARSQITLQEVVWFLPREELGEFCTITHFRSRPDLTLILAQ